MLIAAIILVFVGTVAIAGWGYLTAARLRETEGRGVAIQRQIAWANSHAIDQQYNYTLGYQDGVTLTPSTTLVNTGAGGIVATGFNNLSAMRSTQSASAATIPYAFNNLAVPPTADGSVFFVRTTAATDPSQPSAIDYYDYLLSYPTPLLGDLFLVHKASAVGTGSMVFSSNIQVNGRVVNWEPTAPTQNLQASAFLAMNSQVTGTVTNLSGNGLVVPDNWTSVPRLTSGYGGTNQPTAVTDGTLNMVNNPNFAPGSINSIMASTGNFSVYEGPVTGVTGVITGLVGGVANQVVDLASLSSGAAYTPQPVQIQQTPLANLNLANVVGTTLNSALPVFNGFSGALNIGIVMVNSANLPNVELTGNLDMVILLGDLVTTNASFDASLAPVIIWVDQSTHPRHIIFLGQSTRQVILVTGAGTGAATYCAFVGVSDLLGAPLPWRLQWINQDCDLEIIPPTQFGYANITGSVRTNWTFNVIDTLTTNTRMVIQRDTSPGSLNTLMPRDAWFSSCYRPQ